MSEEFVEKEENETPAEDSTKTNPEENQTSPEEVNSEVDWKAEAEKNRLEAEKAIKIAENYRKENEKYRKKPERIEKISIPSISTEQEVLLEHDYLSKKKDVLDEFQEDISALETEEWQKIEHLIGPATDKLFQEAVSKKGYVARGEIKRVVSNLISFAKGEKHRKAELEKARLEGAKEHEQMEDAEISGVKSRKKGLPEGVSEKDVERAKQTGKTPEAERDLRKKREDRDREYAIKDPLAGY